jgi:predicted nucleotidyltransferase
MDLEGSIAAMREALLADRRIAAAILFGSAARGHARRSSDLDVGVVAGSPGEAREIESEYLKLVAALSAAAQRDVHLVVLDHADPVLGRQVFAGGRTLFERDVARKADVLERILIEYFDGEYHRRMRRQALEHRHQARRG